MSPLMFSFLKKPHVPPSDPVTLPGEMWGITVFFNPCGYKSRHENMKRCLANLKKQGLKIILVELAFTDNSFEFSVDYTDKVIQLRSDDIMWQKEALINIGIKNLPESCDKVVWFDADIIFSNETWMEKTSQLLEKYHIVQPFEDLIRLPKNEGQFEYQNLHKKIEGIITFPKSISLYGSAKAITQNGGKSLTKSYLHHGLTGYAWAARKETIASIGLYDACILGSSDHIFVHGIYGVSQENFYEDISPDFFNNQKEWMQDAHSIIGGSVSYTPGTLYHLWHGARENRRYEEWPKIWKKYAFSPETDIRKNTDGVWEWASKKSGLHAWIRDYFWFRKEDS